VVGVLVVVVVVVIAVTSSTNGPSRMSLTTTIPLPQDGRAA
jgi:hypothetical protein